MQIFKKFGRESRQNKPTRIIKKCKMSEYAVAGIQNIVSEDQIEEIENQEI